jgi:hypothetical protein
LLDEEETTAPIIAVPELELPTLVKVPLVDFKRRVAEELA